MWRQTGDCQPDGPREPENDRNCDEHIEYESGFCECRNGQKAMKKGCELPYYNDVNYDTCQEACANLGSYAILQDIKIHSLYTIIRLMLNVSRAK